MKSRRVSIILQLASWCLRKGREQLERRIDTGWDCGLSMQLDQVVLAEDLIRDAQSMERAA